MMRGCDRNEVQCLFVCLLLMVVEKGDECDECNAYDDYNAIKMMEIESRS